MQFFQVEYVIFVSNMFPDEHTTENYILLFGNLTTIYLLYSKIIIEIQGLENSVFGVFLIFLLFYKNPQNLRLRLQRNVHDLTAFLWFALHLFPRSLILLRTFPDGFLSGLFFALSNSHAISNFTCFLQVTKIFTSGFGNELII